MTNSGSKRLAALAFASILAIGACSSPGGGASPSAAASTEASAPTTASNEASPPAADLSGSVKIDGSSTVYPITEAVAEEFQKANSGVQVTVAFAGTGGGFKRFCNGETDINDASRPIKKDDDGEGKACTANGIDYVELQVAIDGLTVVVNPANTFVTCLTIDELKKIYGPDSPQGPQVERRRPGFPSRAGQALHAGRRLRDLRLLHRGDQRRGRRGHPGRDPVRGRQRPGHGRRRRRQRASRSSATRTSSRTPTSSRPLEVDGGAAASRRATTTINDGTYTPLRAAAVHLPGHREGEGASPELKAFVDFYLANTTPFPPKSATSRCPTTCSRSRRTPGRPPSAAERSSCSSSARTGSKLGSSRCVASDLLPAQLIRSTDEARPPMPLRRR